MRVKEKHMTMEKIAEMTEKISSHFEDSMVTWAVQGYDRYRFDFYFFKEEKPTLWQRIKLLIKKLSGISL